MTVLDRLERKWRRYSIKGLMLYISILNMTVYLIEYLGLVPGISGLLALDPSRILQGEVWRLITFIFIPPPSSVIFILITLYFYYMIGTQLEHTWGSFKLNIYYLLGMVGTIAAAFLTGAPVGSVYLNLSLFLAFAYLYPNYEIMLFFFVPVKMKYLALLEALYIAYSVIVLPLPYKAAALSSILGFLVFFGKDIVTGSRQRGNALYRKQQFRASIPKKKTMHKCTICGMTEKDDLQMEFRYCSQCEGDYEYCMNHLRNHTHITRSAQEDEEKG